MRKWSGYLTFSLGFCFILISFSQAQTVDSIKTDSIMVDLLNVYIDCDYCDFDYLRENVEFANFVRDRQQADIHILVTRQYTASRGREYTLEFIGREKFNGMSDTLKFITQRSDTDDAIRKQFAKFFKLGLVRFAAHESLRDDLKISFTKPVEKKEIKDDWNYWVFQLSANCWLNGQETHKSVSFYQNFDARRVTEKNNLGFGFWWNYNEDKFDYDGDKTLSISRSKGMDAQIILGINDHWSFGSFYDAYTSTYSNRDFTFTTSSGLEYNIYPYKESTRRMLTLQYRLGFLYSDYTEETIYFKSHEWLTHHRFQVELELTQPWGSAEAELYALQYLHDLNRYRISLYGDLEVKLVEGLSLSIDGQISRIYDQISLSNEGASEDEVLLRRKELATKYRYWTGFSLNYSFGSIYDNIVNPRF